MAAGTGPDDVLPSERAVVDERLRTGFATRGGCPRTTSYSLVACGTSLPGGTGGVPEAPDREPGLGTAVPFRVA